MPFARSLEVNWKSFFSNFFWTLHSNALQKTPFSTAHAPAERHLLDEWPESSEFLNFSFPILKCAGLSKEASVLSQKFWAFVWGELIALIGFFSIRDLNFVGKFMISNRDSRCDSHSLALWTFGGSSFGVESTLRIRVGSETAKSQSVIHS